LNLILFTPDEISRPLPRSDARARHLLEVLHRGPGDQFDCGLVNGPRGKGTLVTVGAAALTIAFTWGDAPPPADTITLVLGLPRPQTARDVLRDATTLGVAALHFVLTEKSERSYAQSTLWSTGEWQRHVLAGAEQAFDTRVPTVAHGAALAETLAALPAGTTRLALDNYEASAPLGACHVIPDKPVVLALGSERGWGAADRTLLREHGFTLVHLGSRVLRTETAVVAALTLVKSARGSL
jgi:RsmE family RNA methyltransferase